jgi:molybdenum cofactor biosynthesis enzyme
MTKAKKTKRDNRIVMYLRVKPEEHKKIAKIAKERGYPHTIASVAAEMFARGLAVAAPSAAS